MNVLLVSGSAAEESHSLSLLRYLQSSLEFKGVSTVLWDLRNNPLPFALAEYHHQPLSNPNQKVREFVESLMRADAIILGTPLYHGSYSGQLKNALDNLNKDSFRNKPVGLVSNGGRSTNGLEHLSAVIRALYGYTLQTQIATRIEDYQKSDGGYTLVSEDIKKRSERFIEELVSLAQILKKVK